MRLVRVILRLVVTSGSDFVAAPSPGVGKVVGKVVGGGDGDVGEWKSE